MDGCCADPDFIGDEGRGRLICVKECKWREVVVAASAAEIREGEKEECKVKGSGRRDKKNTTDGGNQCPDTQPITRTDSRTTWNTPAARFLVQRVMMTQSAAAAVCSDVPADPHHDKRDSVSGKMRMSTNTTRSPGQQ